MGSAELRWKVVDVWGELAFKTAASRLAPASVGHAPHAGSWTSGSTSGQASSSHCSACCFCSSCCLAPACCCACTAAPGCSRLPAGHWMQAAPEGRRGGAAARLGVVAAPRGKGEDSTSGCPAELMPSMHTQWLLQQRSQGCSQEQLRWRPPPAGRSNASQQPSPPACSRGLVQGCCWCRASPRLLRQEAGWGLFKAGQHLDDPLPAVS